jgi:drug/metabolite transporter (DMT)-like permease
MVLSPGTHLPAERGKLLAGALFGVIAGLGQAGGAVLSRKANEVALATGMHVDGGTAAYQRMIGGVLVTAVIYALAKSALFAAAAEAPPSERRKGWMWMLLNGVTGPSLGVACYQWALSVAPSGVVLPIVATTPVATMPLAYLMDGDRPSRRSIIGGVIAVAGSVALALVR